jgi:hypothetical protein
MAVRMKSSLILLTAALLSFSLAAQIPDLEPGQPNYYPPRPTVMFTLDFPTGDPTHYAIAVESSGNAAYRSDAGEPASGKQPATGDPNIDKFTISPATARRIFKLAEKLNYFQGNFDNSRPDIANTGNKTLIYADPKRHFSTTYNYSQNPDIEQLTSLFQTMSTTMEAGRRLQHEYRFDKLGLTAELRRLSDLAKSGQASEITAITPILQEIAQDTSVMHIARTEAERLLNSHK